MNRKKSFPNSLLLRSLSAIAISLLLAASAWTQAPEQQGEDKAIPHSKVERKNKAPVSKQVLQVKLPKPVEAMLENGLTVLIMEDHRFPVVSVQFMLSGAGDLYEPRDLPGLAMTTAQMLREGTKTRNSRQMAEEVDKAGATLSASSAFGSSATNIRASGLSDNFDQWFALAVDALLNPTFPADELAKLKQRMKVALEEQRSEPSFLARERFHQAVFGTHPAAVVSATNESIDAMTPALLAKWHAERYAPQNAILGIAGDVRATEVVPKLKKWLAGWQKTSLKETLPPNPTPAKVRRVYLVDRPESVQTTLVLGNLSIARRDPDYIPLVVMNRILGEGGAARLFLNLREEKGYTYGVYSFFSALKYPGAWEAAGDFRTEVTGGAMVEFMKEFERIRSEKVPQSELDDAKRAVAAGFALSLEQPQELLGYAITRKIYDLPADYWDTYPAKIQAVTADDVERVARKYVNPASMQIVAVGDGSKIKSVLEKYGAVEVYDSDGKPVGAVKAELHHSLTSERQGHAGLW